MNNEIEKNLARSGRGLICSTISGFRMSGGTRENLKMHVKKVGLNIKSQKRETGMLDLTETSWVNV
jgi:hypothetical protein